MEIPYYTKTIDTPVGHLRLIGSEYGLYAVLWETDDDSRVTLPPALHENRDYPLFLETEKQLAQYFKGTLKTFTIPLDFDYGTPFQREVWKALTEIPYGEVRTYARQAEEIGKVKAVRAVGSANGKNPLSIIVPCHRVIASSGKLGGFAGGLKVKQYK